MDKTLAPRECARRRASSIARGTGTSMPVHPGITIVPAASRRSPLLNPSHYGAPHDTSTLEGFLFPATYDTNPGEPASRLVEEQLVAFLSLIFSHTLMMSRLDATEARWLRRRCGRHRRPIWACSSDDYSVRARSLRGGA